MFAPNLPTVEPGPLIILIAALVLDAIVGDPAGIYRRLPHPVVLMGKAIDWLDRAFNAEGVAPLPRRLLGVLAIVVLLALAALIGWGLAQVVRTLPGGWIWEALLISTLLAQGSLAGHVRAVAEGLETGGLEGGRRAVALIVGRDVNQLDEAGVARAAIESAAENFSDGVAAPVFWCALFGLPGLVVYKMLNTADSMIGHRSERHEHFGWAAARLDDLANLIPARLSGLLIVLAAYLMQDARSGAALGAMGADVRRHRSPNAGWPEAATAGALGVRLAGPRVYAEGAVEDAWMNAAGAEPDAGTIRQSLRLIWLAWGCTLALVAAGAVIVH